jgi:DNA polymerase
MNFHTQVTTCQKCAELATTRKNVVLGEGAIPCQILFLGEAPGEVEDRTGKPFRGSAGQILRTLVYVTGISMNKCHILNVLKCHPPGNRNPTEEELHNCRPYLLHQIKVIRSKVIVALGKYAQAFVLNQDPKSVRSLKNIGKVVDYQGTPAVLTFHPSYLSYNNRPEVEAAFKIHLKTAKKIALQPR